MDKIKSLRQSLKKGDKTLIAEMSNCSVHTVHKIFSKTDPRNPNTSTGKLILKNAERVIEARQKLLSNQ